MLVAIAFYFRLDLDAFIVWPHCDKYETFSEHDTHTHEKKYYAKHNCIYYHCRVERSKYTAYFIWFKCMNCIVSILFLVISLYFLSQVAFNCKWMGRFHAYKQTLLSHWWFSWIRASTKQTSTTLNKNKPYYRIEIRFSFTQKTNKSICIYSSSFYLHSTFFLLLRICESGKWECRRMFAKDLCAICVLFLIASQRIRLFALSSTWILYMPWIHATFLRSYENNTFEIKHLGYHSYARTMSIKANGQYIQQPMYRMAEEEEKKLNRILHNDFTVITTHQKQLWITSHTHTHIRWVFFWCVCPNAIQIRIKIHNHVHRWRAPEKKCTFTFEKARRKSARAIHDQ